MSGKLKKLYSESGIIFLMLLGPLVALWAGRGCSISPPNVVNTDHVTPRYQVYNNKNTTPGSSFIGGRTQDGEVLTVDLPGDYHIKNIGSLVDGYGMCVMSSIEMAAKYQNMGKEWDGLRDWCAKDPGGAYPTKVIEQLDAYAKAKGIKEVRSLYVQYEGPNAWPIIKSALDSGRMACVTYGTSPRYGNSRIAHMVNLVKADGKYGVILDNNFPGEESYEWMPVKELERRVSYPSGIGWVFLWLTPPPPPSPRN